MLKKCFNSTEIYSEFVPKARLQRILDLLAGKSWKKVCRVIGTNNNKPNDETFHASTGVGGNENNKLRI